MDLQVQSLFTTQIITSLPLSRMNRQHYSVSENRFYVSVQDHSHLKAITNPFTFVIPQFRIDTLSLKIPYVRRIGIVKR